MIHLITGPNPQANKMTLGQFKDKANEHLKALSYLCYKALRHHGDKSTDCQRTALLLKIQEVEHLVTGVLQPDMHPPVRKVVGVVGYDAAGDFAIIAGGMVLTEEQAENNTHLDVVEALAEKLGVEDVRARFDDDNPDGAAISMLFPMPPDYAPLDISEWTDDELDDKISGWRQERWALRCGTDSTRHDD